MGRHLYNSSCGLLRQNDDLLCSVKCCAIAQWWMEEQLKVTTQSLLESDNGG